MHIKPPHLFSLRLACLVALGLGSSTLSAQTFTMSVLPPIVQACSNNTATTVVRVSPVNGFNDAVFLSAPQGSNYRISGFAPQPITPINSFPVSSTMFVYFFPTAAGPITIPITGTPLGGGLPRTTSVRFDITPSLVGVLLNPYTPKRDQTDIGLHPRFAWSAFPTVSFTAAVDDNAVFPPLESVNTNQNDIRFTDPLEARSNYTFSVQATNSCSTTNVLMVSATTAQACFFVDQAIPDNGTLVSTVSVAGNVVESLRLTLGIDHARAGDLRISLRKGGTSAVVLDRPGVPATTNGCSKANIETVLRDSAEMSNENQCEPFGPALAGPLRPSQPMSTFEGLPATGDWVLTVEDLAPQQTGRLVEWCLSSGNTPDDPPFIADGMMKTGFESP